MHLVTTKPGIILADDEEQTLAPEINRSILEKRTGFAKCFVELGSGSGMHLLQLAAQNPDTLCVGIEIRFKRAFRTGEKAEEMGLSNVLVLRSDAKQIDEIFAQGSVDGFYINYPDPWEKRKWRKNRLVNRDFVTKLHSLLKPGGILRFKTDHHEYFSSSLPLFVESEWTRTKFSRDIFASEYTAENIPTEFEMLFKYQRKELCILEVMKN